MKTADLDALAREIANWVEPDQAPMGQDINSILTILDDWMVKANNPQTYREVEAEAIGIGQIQSRCQLILSFIEANQPCSRDGKWKKKLDGTVVRRANPPFAPQERT